MSIWTSIGEGLSVPFRENYTGDEMEDLPETQIDVATATAFHDCVRLTLDGEDTRGSTRASVTLAETDVLRLIDLLNVGLQIVTDMRDRESAIRDEHGARMAKDAHIHASYSSPATSNIDPCIPRCSGCENKFYTDLGREIAWEVERYGDPFLMGVMARVRAGDGFTQNGEEAP